MPFLFNMSACPSLQPAGPRDSGFAPALGSSGAATPSPADIVDVILVSAVRWHATRVSVTPRVGAYVVTVEGVVGSGISTRLDRTVGSNVVARLQKLVQAGQLDVLSRSGRASFDVTVERTAIGTGVTLHRARVDARVDAESVGTDLGDYRLVAVLRNEDDCIVYRAVHRVFGRQFALKVPQCSEASIEEANGAIVREARALAHVDHDGVPRAIGIAELPDGRVALVLDQAISDGESLADHVRRHGPLGASRALAVARQVALALDACHQAGVSHGNVSLESILLGESDTIRLSGFGATTSADASSVRTDLEATLALVDALTSPGTAPALRAGSAGELAEELANASSRHEQPAWRRWLSR